MNLKTKIVNSDLNDLRNLENLLNLCVLDKDIKTAYIVLDKASDMVKNKNIEFFSVYKNALKFLAPYDFDKYCIYLEINRPAKKRFYLPRRKVLITLVKDLQDLEERKIDFLGISLPPRVGKSTLCIFFITWIMGRNPDAANVMSGHSDKLTEGFYREILNIISDKETYTWSEIFPNVKIANISAKNETIDLNKAKRFPTTTCRSVTGTLTGAVEVSEDGYLYCDDLIADLEESLNPQRLDNKYDAYLNQLKDRKKDGARELMVGTRWNVLDPLGRIQEQYKDNPRYRFRIISALDENGESNFNYQYKLGFSTDYYKDMKDSIDSATWWAKYMGKPYVREGIVFKQDELNYYNGVLPDIVPDRVLSVCDVAWGGGDSLSYPVAYVFGDSVYIHDWVFNNKDKTVTKPLVVGMSMKHKIQTSRFEANNGGDEYAEDIDRMLKENGYRMNISSKKSLGNQSKLSRILQYAPDIKKFYFLDFKHRTVEYQKAMDELCTFVQIGKNLHDDAADSLAMLADELYAGGLKKVQVFKRYF